MRESVRLFLSFKRRSQLGLVDHTHQMLSQYTVDVSIRSPQQSSLCSRPVFFGLAGVYTERRNMPKIFIEYSHLHIVICTTR